ncbi:hypothetical protein ACRALDRAFT_1068596 [Sodiomyces alcalophilus JCM 7366]|uniref:uncharacterized protein n=1 Tax=Sodiomyces alcalophilus JCM 7366 TaxID=591952 RepID=UPI0039B6A28B
MSSSESERSSSPDTTAASKKRKADLEQLEIDIKAPEPPSKRARRLLKKGKVLPPKPTSDDEAEDETGEKKEKDKKKKSAAATRSEHGVWIGNLPFDATPAELQAWLVENAGGAVTDEAITRVHMPTTTKHVGWQGTKTNKGFAYVDFADVGSKVAAIALTENELRHRKLLIKDASSYEGRPKKEARDDNGGGEQGDRKKSGDAQQQPKKPASRKIFVGNMGFATTEDDLRANFEKCGEIDWVKVATFEDSGKCKGYGWVKFREPEAAEWAVKGFVKVKEEVETEDDFVTKDDDEEEEEGEGKEEKEAEKEDGDDSDDKAKKKKNKENKKQFKMRKWWVNRIMGRTLKIELAEDDQTRYKKRYGKDAVRRQQQHKATAQAANGDAAASEHKAKTRPAPSKELKVQDDLMVARLMGTVAKPTGTKITFD